MDITLIDEGVYQGGSLDVIPQGIQAVLSLEQRMTETNFPNPPGFQALCWMPIPDAPPFPGVGWLDAAVDFVENAVKNGWKIIIHCQMGVSRSGMVDVAFWMRHKQMTRDQALAFVRSKRPITNPNPYFLAGLTQYEEYLKTK